MCGVFTHRQHNVADRPWYGMLSSHRSRLFCDDTTETKLGALGRLAPIAPIYLDLDILEEKVGEEKHGKKMTFRRSLDAADAKRKDGSNGWELLRRHEAVMLLMGGI